jgi:hypothetical protein
MPRLPNYPEQRFTLRNGILVIRQHPSNRRASMKMNEQYLSYAADCQLMACGTRDEHERQT